MADITFPSYVKVLLWDEAPNNNAVLRTPMENGVPVQARRFTRNLGTVNMNILMTEAQANAFVTWHTDTALDGAKWFDIDDPRTGSTVEMRILNGAYSLNPFNVKQNYFIIAFTGERFIT